MWQKALDVLKLYSWGSSFLKFLPVRKKPTKLKVFLFLFLVDLALVKVYFQFSATNLKYSSRKQKNWLKNENKSHWINLIWYYPTGINQGNSQEFVVYFKSINLTKILIFRNSTASNQLPRGEWPGKTTILGWHIPGSSSGLNLYSD